MHIIRLRGPWQLAPLDPVTNEPVAAIETEIPGDWSAALAKDFCGAVRLTRRFGLPTNLSSQEYVFLVVRGLDQQAGIELNGQALLAESVAGDTTRYHITPLLEPRNELCITLQSQAYRPNIIGEVRLEIEER